MGLFEEVHVGRQARTATGHGHLEGYGPHGSAMGEKKNHGCGFKKGVRNTLVCVYPHNLTRLMIQVAWINFGPRSSNHTELVWIGMATGRVGVGWSFRGPTPKIRE